MYPDNVGALSNEARFFSDLYNFSYALKLVDKALTIQSNDVGALTNKGYVYYSSDNYSSSR